MIAVTYREKQLLLLLRKAPPGVRRRLLKQAMKLVSERIRPSPGPANDNLVFWERKK